MAHKKGQGSSRNGRDSNSQRRGIKVYGGERVKAGAVIVRQVGSTFHAGKGAALGKDYTGFPPVGGVAASGASAVGGAAAADLKNVLPRLAGDVATIESFLGENFPRLVGYVHDLGKGAARGRTVEEVVNDANVRKELASEIHAFAKQ